MHPTMTKVPEPKQKYRHANGAEYEVICLAKDDDRDELLVIHKGPGGAVWARPVGNFMGLRDGAPRFTLVE